MAVGSFLNVLIIRLGSEQDFWSGGPAKRGHGLAKLGGRSVCPKCRHILAWQDLIPVLSFILLGGRCRYCREKISWQYPIVELATGILFVFLAAQVWNLDFGFWNFIGNWKLEIGNLIDFIYLLFIASCLIVIFVSDLKFFIIPDEIIIAGAAGAFLYRLFSVWDFKILNLFRISNFEFRIFQPLGISLLAGIGALAFFGSIVLITRGRGMGLGDVKLAFLMGLVLGWPQILPALFLAFVFGAFVGLCLIIVSQAKFTPSPRKVWGMKSEIPFGTFLAASTFVLMIFGEQFLNFYHQIIF